MKKYITKDSGKRIDYPSGMRRDVQDDKPNFKFLLVPGMPYGEQYLTRCAGLLSRGAKKYGAFNFTKADSEEELERFKVSALRHMIQWITDENDEDHSTAIWFNIMAAEMVKWKLERRQNEKNTKRKTTRTKQNVFNQHKRSTNHR